MVFPPAEKAPWGQGISPAFGVSIHRLRRHVPAVTLFMIQHDLTVAQLESMNAEEMDRFLDHIKITFQVNPETKLSEVHLNGLNVERQIRDLRISDLVSPVSAIPAIRRRMVKKQQGYGRDKGSSWMGGISALRYSRMRS